MNLKVTHFLMGGVDKEILWIRIAKCLVALPSEVKGQQIQFDFQLHNTHTQTEYFMY